MFGFILFLIISFLVLTNKPSDDSTLSVAYIPQLIRIPDRVYSLSQLILKYNIDFPLIPTEIIDPNLNVLSVRVSRLRSGGSATFIIAKQKELLNIEFWCLFDDGSITPVYIFHIKKSKDYILFLECSLPDSIIRRLWYDRTIDQEIKIYLSTSKKILLQGFLDIPWSNWSEDNEQSLTLCTHSLDIKLTYFIQWIEFHRLVGISKFIIYNISNINHEFDAIIDSYEEEYPSLIDIIQWNYSLDEIQYDCFLRYGDISEWIIKINLNEYLIPRSPYDTLSKLLTEQYGRNLQSSVILENHEFCPDMQWKTLLIEQYILRIAGSNRSDKYFYRPRAIDYLSINQDDRGTNSLDQMKKNIVLAHYPVMEDGKIISNCLRNSVVEDTSIRNRFAKRLFNETYKYNRVHGSEPNM